MSATSSKASQSSTRHAFRPAKEAQSLANLMRQAAQELKNLSAEVNLVEREIEEFNRYYYAEVGAIYEEYKRLKTSQEQEQGDEFLLETPQKMEKTDPIVATLSKKIFRRVAKICHPDTNGQSELFVKLNDAYQAQDLGSLLLLEQQLHQGKTGKFIEEQLDMMERAKEALDRRRAELMNSPAYKLRQKIFWAKMGGQDLIAQIKRHLKRQISAIKYAI